MSTGMIPAAKPLISDEERFAVDRVLASGMLVQGPEVAAFEEEFSALVGGRHCIAVNSGPARCTWACSLPGSARATRSSCRHSASRRPRIQSR